MKRAVQKSCDFTADFEQIFAWYVDEAGGELAWRFQAALDIALVRLALRPDLGRIRHFRHPALSGLRSFPVEPPFNIILIFYRATSESLDALRLIHGARNLPRRLRKPPATS